MDAYPDKTFTGKVSRISPAVNTARRALAFEALVPNSETLLKPGTFARVHIESGTLLLVPVAYVKFDALEQSALNQEWRGLLVRVKTPRRMQPATETCQG